MPIEQRERYREALDLVMKAWSAKEMFAWNGKHYQLPMVNLWPRPIQQPHPPIWIPGSGSPRPWSSSSSATTASATSATSARSNARVAGRLLLGHGGEARAATPTRTGWASCSWSACRRRDAAGRGVRPARRVLLPQAAAHALVLPGDPRLPGLRQPASAQCANRCASASTCATLSYKDFVDRGFLIAGSPATVRDQLLEGIKRLRIGHLMVLLHFGSMPHELCLKNIDLFCREVLPHLRGLLGRRVGGPLVAERLRAPLNRPPTDAAAS